MDSKLYLAACDLGASSGRVILGCYDGSRLTTQEVHRFENGYIEENGMPVWDILRIKEEVIKGLCKASEESGGRLSCFGIDTWGVDYGLISKEGKLLGNPRSYRHSADEDMIPVFEKIPFQEIYSGTGIAAQSYNTLFQLYRRKMEGDAALSKAESLLMTPDLIAYLLTGEKRTEYTIATTSMMLDPETRDWNRNLLNRLGLPTDILTEVEMPGTLRGRILAEISEQTGLGRIFCASVGSHDTASAVAAIPGRGDFAFLSSGTWSLLGIEKDTATFEESLRDAGISNEGTVQGGFRLLKNIIGMWLIQECRKKWKESGCFYTWDDITSIAEKEKPFRSVIDPDSSLFFNAPDILEAIREYCRRTSQPEPETPGQFARCIYESLALKYRLVLTYLEEVKGRKTDCINIVGGGINNVLLNQMSADATGHIVITGPVESAAAGNLLVQAMALGEVRDVTEIREIVRNSTETKTYEPRCSCAWDEAYGKLCNAIEIMKEK